MSLRPKHYDGWLIPIQLYSDMQKFKARYERERSLSSEPDDRMDLDSKELEVER